MSTNVVKPEKRSNRKPAKKAASKPKTTKMKNDTKPIEQTTGNPFVDLMGKYKDEPLWDDFIEAIRKNRIKDRRNFKD